MKAKLKRLASGESLSAEETRELLGSFMQSPEDSAEADVPTDAQIGAFLYATACRRPSSDEIAGGVSALRDYMRAVPADAPVTLLDTAGTGGSGFNTFNTSTVAALVCAGAGQRVAKHGNRGATSKCGSADLLEALGVQMSLSPETLAKCLAETGFCFMFAPGHHPATKRVALIRKQLGFRTIFNFLGPLTNPASARLHVMGVSDVEMMETIAEALLKLGTLRTLVVRGEDGIDEISLCSETRVLDVSETSVKETKLSPEQFGFSRVSMEDIVGGEPNESARVALSLLDGYKSPYRDLVLMNAGAALYIGGKADSIEGGISLAAKSIDSGSAAEVLQKVKTFTQEHACQ